MMHHAQAFFWTIVYGGLSLVAVSFASTLIFMCLLATRSLIILWRRLTEDQEQARRKREANSTRLQAIDAHSVKRANDVAKLDKQVVVRLRSTDDGPNDAA